MVPENLLYTKEQEWVKVDDDSATFGITDYAKEKLGDIVFVELPEVGSKIEQMKQFGVVESVKAVSELYAPITGEVIEVNSELNDNPGLVNEEPYAKGWIIKVKILKKEELNDLLKPEEYIKLTE